MDTCIAIYPFQGNLFATKMDATTWMIIMVIQNRKGRHTRKGNHGKPSIDKDRVTGSRT